MNRHSIPLLTVEPPIAAAINHRDQQKPFSRPQPPHPPEGAPNEAQDRHTTQYFEIFGNRGIYHRGWTAVTLHRPPWPVATPGLQLTPFDQDRWELYDTTTDWSQSQDLADQHPELLDKLKQLSWSRQPNIRSSRSTTAPSPAPPTPATGHRTRRADGPPSRSTHT